MFDPSISPAAATWPRRWQPICTLTGRKIHFKMNDLATLPLLRSSRRDIPVSDGADNTWGVWPLESGKNLSIFEMFSLRTSAEKGPAVNTHSARTKAFPVISTLPPDVLLSERWWQHSTFPPHRTNVDTGRHFFFIPPDWNDGTTRHTNGFPSKERRTQEIIVSDHFNNCGCAFWWQVNELVHRVGPGSGESWSAGRAWQVTWISLSKSRDAKEERVLGKTKCCFRDQTSSTCSYVFGGLALGCAGQFDRCTSHAQSHWFWIFSLFGRLDSVTCRQNGRLLRNSRSNWASTTFASPSKSDWPRIPASPKRPLITTSSSNFCPSQRLKVDINWAIEAAPLTFCFGEKASSSSDRTKKCRKWCGPSAGPTQPETLVGSDQTDGQAELWLPTATKPKLKAHYPSSLRPASWKDSRNISCR